jgi:hypothetical protein
VLFGIPQDKIVEDMIDELSQRTYAQSLKINTNENESIELKFNPDSVINFDKLNTQSIQINDKLYIEKYFINNSLVYIFGHPSTSYFHVKSLGTEKEIVNYIKQYHNISDLDTFGVLCVFVMSTGYFVGTLYF